VKRIIFLLIIVMVFVSIPLHIVVGQGEAVDFSNTVTVKEFTEMVLKAIAREATMDYAISKEFVRPLADYPSYEKPILRREAALTVARIMDDITGMPALFTNGKNDYFWTGYTLNHRLQRNQIDELVNIGMKNGNYDKYFTLIYWHDYIGNIKDLRMITKEYLKEMATTYFAGLLDADENGRLRPYDFLTKDEAKILVERLKRYDTKDSKKAVEQLADYVRELDIKPMENFLKSIGMRLHYTRMLDGTYEPEPEIEAPSNKELWVSICPYVNKRLYEYPFRSEYGITSNKQLEINRQTNPLDIFNNAFAHLNDYENYVLITKNYMNTRYNIDYRTLDVEVPYYGPIVANKEKKKEAGDYRTRVLFYFNPEDILNEIEDENGNRRPESQWIMPDDMIDAEIEKIKKYKIVSQADFITHDSLMYYMGGGHIRGTLRIIFYPPTDPEYLKSKGLEVGKWYEIDVEVLFSNRVFMKGDRAKYRDRWAFTLLFYDDLIDLNSMSYLRLNDLLDFKSFRPMEELK